MELKNIKKSKTLSKLYIQGCHITLKPEKTRKNPEFDSLGKKKTWKKSEI